MSSRAVLAALTLCALNPLATLAVVGWDTEPLGLITQVIALGVTAPIIAWLQILAVLVVRNETSSWVIVPILLLSAAAAIDYAHMAFTLDLASSSTAGLALALYPVLRQPIWVLPLGAVLIWFGRRRGSRDRAE